MRKGFFLKKLSAAFTACVVAISSLAVVEVNAMFTPDKKIYSSGAYMVNMDTDIVVYATNETDRFYPASTTKIMTALLTLDMVTDLDAKVEITAASTNEFASGDPNKTGPSACAIELGQDNVTYRDCLYGLMLASACEAANVLAYNIGGGDISVFVDMMNQKAKEIGCVNTNFANPHGLHDKDNYSCAYDLYLITKYAYDNLPEFEKIVSTYQYEFPPNKNNPDGYYVTNTNALMKNNTDNPYFYEYASGVKTGSIDRVYDLETGESSPGYACLVSTAHKDGFNYMIVTLGAPYGSEDEPYKNASYYFKDHITLYEWAFASLAYVEVLTQKDIIGEIPVEQGEDADRVQLRPIEDYHTLLPKGIDRSAIQQVVKYNAQSLVAPVVKGTVLGSVELRLSDQTLSVINLVAADDIALSQTAYIADKIKDVLDQTWLKVGVGVILGLVVVLGVLSAINKSNKKKNNRRPPNSRIKR